MELSKVNFYQYKLRAEIDKSMDKILDKLALQALGEARIQIRNNGQIDTGFMTNSGYVVTAHSDSYGEMREPGEFKRASGRVKADKVDVSENESALAFAAHYAIYQEMYKSFLFAALVKVVGHFGGIVREAKF